jgi:hypothetical protein
LAAKSELNNLFWVQSQTVNLARVLGNDQPLLAVSLTEEDFARLGQQPSTESIGPAWFARFEMYSRKVPTR